jgi:hypothetical protein
MFVHPGRSQALSVTRRVVVLVLVLAVAALTGGCGGSSKPKFCSTLGSLQKSVGSLSVSGGLSSVKSQLQTIQSQGKTLVSSAKSDFPDQTTAIDNAVSKLGTDIKQIPSSPTPQQLASVAADVKAVVSSVNDLASASKSKCQ